MKKWEHEAFCEATAEFQTGYLASWPELQEALAANGVSLLLSTPMKAVREICRLILSERKTTEANAERSEARKLQIDLLHGGIYVNLHDIAECYREFSNDFGCGCSWLPLDYWDDADHIGPVDYIAARVSNGKPN